MNIKFRKCTLDDFDFMFKLKKENFKKYVDNIWGWNDEDQIERMRIDLEENLEQKQIIIFLYNYLFFRELQVMNKHYLYNLIFTFSQIFSMGSSVSR